MSTPNRMQTHWKELATFIKKEWPKLSPTAINTIDGDYDRFLKYLKESYNNFPAEEAKARTKIQAFLNQLEKNDSYR